MRTIEKRIERLEVENDAVHPRILYVFPPKTLEEAVAEFKAHNPGAREPFDIRCVCYVDPDGTREYPPNFEADLAEYEAQFGE